MKKNTEIYAKRSYPLRRIMRKLIFYVATSFPFLKAEFRSKLHKLAGVRIVNASKTFIGQNVYFDDLYPEDIIVDEGTFITSGCKILSHFMDPSCRDYSRMKRGVVSIGKNVFLGMNVVIVKPVSIGDGAVVGANSVVVKDIPPYTIWAGNPAVFVKKREINNI